MTAPPLTGMAKVIMEAFADAPGLFGAPVYAAQAPQLQPDSGVFITYETVGGIPITYSEADIPDKRNSRAQLEVWGPHPGVVADLADKMVAIAARNIRMTVLTEVVASFDRNVELYGARFDVSVWWDRNNP